MSERKKRPNSLTVRFEIIDGMFDKLEELRLRTPIQDRLNRSAFIRKIIIEYIDHQYGKKDKTG